MRKIEKYHHFKKELIKPSDRLAKCERYVVDVLLTSKVSDTERDSSVCWELKHQASVRQFAALIAQKRALPVDVCIVGLLLHDIYSVVYGTYMEHAHRGAPKAMEILTDIGGFSEVERDQIWRIIYHHSDKDVWSDDAFVEFGKDIDVLDCFLYEGAFDYYLANKPLPIFKHYLKRASNIWAELGFQPDSRFRVLEGYGPAWFECIQTVDLSDLENLISIFIDLININKDGALRPPPFCILVEDDEAKFFANRKSFVQYAHRLSKPSSIIGRKKVLIQELLTELSNNKSESKLKLDIPNTKKQMISKKSLEDASNILIDQDGPNRNVKIGFLFWPLLDTYETLLDEKLVTRFGELGLAAPNLLREN